MKSSSLKTVNLLLVSSLVLGLSLSSCDRGAKKVIEATGADKGAPAPADQDPHDADPYEPIDPNNPNQTEMPQEPTDTPEPKQAPKTPMAADSGVPMAIRAIAKTTAFVAPASLGGVKGTYVNIELTWQPVYGAKEYWIYKTALPTKEQAQKGNAYKIVAAEGFLSTIFVDGVLPPSFAGGNIWEKIKKGFSALTIKPGTEYKYKVVAVNEEGTVIGESDAGSTTPLPAVAAPVKLTFDPSSYNTQTNTLTPTPSFVWDKSDGIDPDGYFVSVHPPILFGKQAADQQGNFGYAFWSTFRLEKTKIARYGSQSDNATAYPGTFPFDVTFPLKDNGRYSVSVTSVKTDTNDMRTARAISKAWSDSKVFQVGGTGTVAPLNPSGTGTNSSTNEQTSTDECNWWCKIKKGASSVIGLVKK